MDDIYSEGDISDKETEESMEVNLNMGAYGVNAAVGSRPRSSSNAQFHQ
jgi:hypothetical protein